MIYRIEVASKAGDTRAEQRKQRLLKGGFHSIDDLSIVDVYTIEAGLSNEEIKEITDMLVNPVVETVSVDKPICLQTGNGSSGWAIEKGFLPGVTDNVSHTVQKSIEDLLKTKLLPSDGVYVSQLTLVSGELSEEDARRIGDSFANPIINSIRIKSYEQLAKDGGMGKYAPKVNITSALKADTVKILDADLEELAAIGKKGIANLDGTRRGPLALEPYKMSAIVDHFREKGRNPTDVELESIAQTWSEHCKHTIFADPIDNIGEGIFRKYIKGSTERIREARGEKDICVSVFTDNAGIIRFDDDFDVCVKVETHNSPSALDPYGGAITGIVGVNRDVIGCGIGAKPYLNISGPFCFADPFTDIPLYKGENFTQRMLSSRKIHDGVVEGVKDGGNCSGIPTTHLKIVYDERFRGKPLVYVGTAGVIPREVDGKPSAEKAAMPGDLVVMVGGRVGKDGIHGATFSSEGMDAGSPVTAVQIGDPITQKKMSDFITKEARDKGLYNSITDNGAGGLSCSIAEMARESGGFLGELDKVPLKYPGLPPWEILVSESQERMTISVPKDRWHEFKSLAEMRDVEASVIGVFNDSGNARVTYQGKPVLDIDMGFLHDGVPEKFIRTNYVRPAHAEPKISLLEDLTETLYSMMARQNIASHEYISRQYDHEVQGGSVLKPLQGRGRIDADATLTKPVLGSKKATVLSQGINPSYSEIDTYHMAACAIDTAVRNAVAAGADLDHLALLDNFCWSDSGSEQRLGELVEAARACYDYTVHYLTPLVSGKDSMWNDFKGFDGDGNPIKISIPPTLLITAFGVMEDSSKAVSIDAKMAGDIVYVLGKTHDELGGSEYFRMVGEKETGKGYTGNNVPKVDKEDNLKLYRAVQECIDNRLIASAKSINEGGLAVALAKSASSGMLGMDITLENLPGTSTRDDYALFSESQGRLVVTVAPQYRDEFEKRMEGCAYRQIGTVRDDLKFTVSGTGGKKIIDGDVESILDSHKKTFEGF